LRLADAVVSERFPLCRALGGRSGRAFLMNGTAMILCAMELTPIAPLLEVEITFRFLSPSLGAHNYSDALGYLILKGAWPRVNSNIAVLGLLEDVKAREQAIMGLIEDFRPLYEIAKGMADELKPECMEIETLEPGRFRITAYLGDGERVVKVVSPGRPSKANTPYCGEFP